MGHQRPCRLAPGTPTPCQQGRSLHPWNRAPLKSIPVRSNAAGFSQEAAARKALQAAPGTPRHALGEGPRSVHPPLTPGIRLWTPPCGGRAQARGHGPPLPDLAALGVGPRTPAQALVLQGCGGPRDVQRQVLPRPILHGFRVQGLGLRV